MFAPQPVLEWLFIANLEEIYQCFGGMYCFHLQGITVASKFLPDQKMSDCTVTVMRT
jgi:hypothetical protein